MKKKTQEGLLIEAEKKKKYFPPTLDVIIIETECGIAANSAAVSPVTVGGNVDQVVTDWNGNDDTTVNGVF